jgi:UDP-N-acetylmuramoylalanine--D-glutamate ligase
MTFEKLGEARKILIYGKGREGMSALAFLTRRFPKTEITAYDDQTDQKPDFAKYDVIVVSPGVPREKLKDAKATLTSGTEIFFDNLPEERRKHLIGVTGTKGKSTTVKFIYEMLVNAGHCAAIGGNFGTALLELYDDFLAKRYEWLIVELSSYQLENLKTSPGIAIYLNLYRDHLDRHHTFSRYRRAKENIFRFQQKGDILIIPSGQTISKNHAAVFAPPAQAALFPKRSLFRAPHLLQNFGAALSVTKLLRIPRNIIAKTAKSFKGLPHRMELFATHAGISFCDDAISTNPDSTMAAVRLFNKQLGSIILGGQDRSQKFPALIAKLKQHHIEIIAIPSEVTLRIIKTAAQLNYKDHVVLANDLKDAVRIAFAKTARGKISLLSTAAPSYGNFKNFEEKGDLFKRYVTDYSNGK